MGNCSCNKEIDSIKEIRLDINRIKEIGKIIILNF